MSRAVSLLFDSFQQLDDGSKREMKKSESFKVKYTFSRDIMRIVLNLNVFCFTFFLQIIWKLPRIGENT